LVELDDGPPEAAAPPDWPWVLPTALAPVPDLSVHSFGIALFEAYFDSSQRASFCATCDFLSVTPLDELMELDELPGGVALVELGVDCIPLVVLAAPEPEGFSVAWLDVVALLEAGFFSLARSPRANADPLAIANTVVNTSTDLRMGDSLQVDEESVRLPVPTPRCRPLRQMGLLRQRQYGLLGRAS
jgi:hypothetical protein